MTETQISNPLGGIPEDIKKEDGFLKQQKTITFDDDEELSVPKEKIIELYKQADPLIKRAFEDVYGEEIFEDVEEELDAKYVHTMLEKIYQALVAVIHKLNEK